MSEYALEMRNQLVGLFGIVERNVYLTRRYIYWDLAFFVWTVANTLTINVDVTMKDGETAKRVAQVYGLKFKEWRNEKNQPLQLADRTPAIFDLPLQVSTDAKNFLPLFGRQSPDVFFRQEPPLYGGR